MKNEIRVPPMGESISDALVGAFLKPSGSYVKADEEILELETDKVNQVIYALHSGQLQWLVEPGQRVTIDQVLGNIDDEAEQPTEAEPPSKPSPSQKLSQKLPAAAADEPKQSVKSVPPVSTDELAETSQVQTIKTTESSAKTTGTSVARISEQQWLSELDHTSSQAEQSKSLPIKATGPSRETARPMSRIRQVIAHRLVEAQKQSAMLTTFNEVDMSAVMNLRSTHQEAFTKQHAIRLGLLPFFVKATVSALRAFPILNSYIVGEEIIERHYYSIGLAVGTDRGLVVPVVRECDKLSFAQIEQQLADYATRARKGRLTVEELQGGGFTITNGGVYGSMLSTPLLNLPQSGILGMHKITKRAVVIEDQIVIRPMMYLALSYDHRLIDGKEAVLFLMHIKEHLEDPARLLLEI
jgi:2-oxoglutarate dehydrogenase E2 component (dihydrolipoamide succinyltransferase)